jgi:hypothetical protein
MKPERTEICSRLIRFLAMDTDGLRRFILQSIVEANEVTVISLYTIVTERFEVSQRVVASMIGYICSRLGILHVSRASYRSPKTYSLREEYADLAKSVLSSRPS